MAAGGEGDLEAGAGVGRPDASGRRPELDGAGQTQLTERSHVRVTGEGVLHLATEERGPFGDLTRGQHRPELAQRLTGDRAGEGVARERVAVEEGAPFGERPEEGLVDLLRGERGGQRQVAGGEALREAEEIRDDAFALGGRERAGAAESGEDLVEDQMHAVAAAEFRDGPQEAGRLLDHAGGALHQRLKDDAGRRGSVTDQQGFQRGQRGGGVGADDLAGAFGVDRRRERLRGEEPGLEAAVELRASPD